MCRDASSFFACLLGPRPGPFNPFSRRKVTPASRLRATYRRCRLGLRFHPWINGLANQNHEVKVEPNTWLDLVMDTYSYDEDLSQSAFFQQLQQEYQPIYQRAIREGWVICVPRCSTFAKAALTEEDFLGHILIPDDEVPGTHFHTLTDREVRLNDRSLMIDDNVGKWRSVQLLFEETFYTDDLHKYCVWCIEGLLEQATNESADEVPVVTSLKECVDLLWSEVQDKSILKELDASIDEFEKAQKNLDNECLQMQRDLVGMLYAKSLRTLLKDTRLRDRTVESRYLLQTIRLTTETYVLHGLRRILPLAVSTSTAIEDAHLNKIIKNLHDLQLHDFGVRPDLYDGVSRGKLELSRLDGHFTVLGKIGCLKRAARFVSQGETSVSSDDFLPVLIYLVVKSGLANWYAQLAFMKQFRFSASSAYEADEAGFLITSLEAAVEHVKSGSLGIGSPQLEVSTLLNGDNHKDEKPLVTTDECGELNGSVKILFEYAKRDVPKESKLCHPLCTCKNCDRSLLLNSSTDLTSAQWRDNRGRNCLHIASLYGQVAVVDYLLEYGLSANDVDIESTAPLHCAAARGHQNTLLLLLHANADINALDSRGNSALHLATDNGHEACVKALLYFAEQTRLTINISAANMQGDTALHFASKWGYRGIVEILLEYGAEPGCKNRRGQTPLNLAHNCHIIRMLEGSSSRTSTPTGSGTSSGYGTTRKEVGAESANEDQSSSSASTPNKLGYRGNTDGIHKINRLFAAVAEGDIRLASYYLGLEGPCSKTYVSEPDESKFCHPLCNCDKCVSIEELAYEKETKPPIAINAVNSQGETALHIASAAGCTEIIQLLLDAGAKVNLVTRSEGRTPLHLACLHEHVQTAKMLLSCGSCNPDVRDNARDTPLHLAARAGNVRIVEMLVRHGANARLRNLNGATPLDEVEHIKSDDIFMSLALSNIAKILKNVDAAAASVANASQ
ncbi:ankyrin repeat domain-containing protein 27-like isoform X2 [Copidosoma floridanum]|uniref:ankyrin repeat domain-containing protein 27-like isoform X2 n=1 Tax=Copidosoma floridanum TaxID=29053 RepID=UPI0006C95511|nr:ankyrin repeat domain-containing protein 27-like isoform X2 [Copidosoma floridanum]